MITVSPNRQLRIKINEGDIQLSRAVPLQLHILDAFAFFLGGCVAGFYYFKDSIFYFPLSQVKRAIFLGVLPEQL